jgi:hypothetical protein
MTMHMPIVTQTYLAEAAVAVTTCFAKPWGDARRSANNPALAGGCAG